MKVLMVKKDIVPIVSSNIQLQFAMDQLYHDEEISILTLVKRLLLQKCINHFCTSFAGSP